MLLLLPMPEDNLTRYNITLVGDWTPDNIEIVKEAVFNVAYKINPIDFAEFFNGITIVWGKEGASKECLQEGIYACTVSKHQINIFNFYKECGKRTPLMAHIQNRNLIVHEIGHVFAKKFKNDLYDLLPYKLLNNKDFYPSPISAEMTWRQSREMTKPEIFADMFLGWVFNRWSGRDKRGWMNFYMPRFLYGLQGLHNNLYPNIHVGYASY